MKIIVWTGFNNGNRPQLGQEIGIDRPLSKKWINFRYDIWTEYTWKSLLNQDFGDWSYVIKCHPDTRKRTDRLFGGIDDRIVLTYGDDDEIAFLRQYEEVLMIRIDSDDMYRHDAIQHYNQLARTYDNEFFLCPSGYIHRMNPEKDGEICTYVPKLSGPFFARRVNGQTFDRIGSGIRHNQVRKRDPFRMPESLFMVGVHGENTTSRMSMATELIPEKRWPKIKKEFGIA